MNINLNFVNKKMIVFLLLAVLFIMGFSCKTAEISEENSVSEDEYYQLRPKLLVDSPVSRLPYTLKWEENRKVRSYEIQMALDQKFTESRQNWTTKEPFLILETIKSDTLYIRIRSHYDDGISRWSELIELKLIGEELRINRLRS